jgi:hypothetical protein
MTDIYKKLAAAVAGGSEEDVPDEMRARAKAAFWEALTQVAQLPGNGALLTALKAQGLEEMQFANFEWQPRWNKAEAVAFVTNDGPAAFTTGFFGVLRFRLDDLESIAAVLNGARRYADMVEDAAKRFNGES